MKVKKEIKELYDGYALTVKNQTENSQVDRSEIKSLSRQYHNEELSRVAPPCPLKRLVRP